MSSNFASGLISSAHSTPLISSKLTLTGSLSDSNYGSWTSNEAAEAHAIAARFKALGIKKEPKACAQEAVNSSDNMDIVPHDKE